MLRKTILFCYGKAGFPTLIEGVQVPVTITSFHEVSESQSLLSGTDAVTLLGTIHKSISRDTEEDFINLFQKFKSVSSRFCRYPIGLP